MSPDQFRRRGSSRWMPPYREVSRRYHQRVAILRLFAQAREAAGTGTATFPGATVGDVIDAAIAQYGATFEAVVNMSKVWVNGEEVPRSHAVTDKDEVAVLPPVSGGM